MSENITKPTDADVRAFIANVARPRRRAVSVTLLAKLDKHRHSSSCLYVNRLENIDLAILEPIVADSLRRMKEIYPQWPENVDPWT